MLPPGLQNVRGAHRLKRAVAVRVEHVDGQRQRGRGEPEEQWCPRALVSSHRFATPPSGVGVPQRREPPETQQQRAPTQTQAAFFGSFLQVYTQFQSKVRL